MEKVLDNRYAYILKNGGQPIRTPEQVSKDKRVFLQIADENYRSADVWWSRESIRKPHYLGNGNLIDPRFVKLHELLLSFGGSETCFPGIEEDMEKIFSRGQLWIGDKVRLIRGQPSQCHTNSCELWENNRKNFEIAIATGYALSKDGLWRQHSWLMLRNPRSVKVIETTVKRVCYFGFVMTDEEANEFCENNLW